MSVYRWQGVSPKGETLKGEMEASSREAVIIRLRSQRIQPQPSRIKEKGKGLDFDIAVPSFGSPVKARDIVVFTRQFATMIDAGLPIVQCLSILAAQTDSKPFRRAITTVKDDVRSEEHTSELQSRLHLVCRLLLEKKKKTRHQKRQSLISTVHAQPYTL